MKELIRALADAIQSSGLLQVEVSARHVHLNQRDLERLFGTGYALHPKRALSQPGQFLSEEKVILAGPKGEKEISVLGPVRDRTQIELSRSDCLSLGISAPVRLSGQLSGTGSVVLKGPQGSAVLTEGVMIAKAHIHMTPEMAGRLHLSHEQRVKLEIITERPVILQDVIVRVDPASSCKAHIDTDEANAAGYEGFTLGRIIP